MLNVLRHYLPARKALLLFSETALLSVVVAAGMSAHLVSPSIEVIGRITHQSLSPSEALARCLVSSVLLVLLCQMALGFNELYDFRISNSRFDRGARFVASAASAIDSASPVSTTRGGPWRRTARRRDSARLPDSTNDASNRKIARLRRGMR